MGECQMYPEANRTPSGQFWDNLNNKISEVQLYPMSLYDTINE